MKHKQSLIFIFLIFALLLTIGSGLVLAQTDSPTELIVQANRFYEAGNYPEAAEIYETQIEAGLLNPILFYNLGNVYFKQGDYGLAILNYRRAERLAPRDSDIETNLNLAREQSLDNVQGDSKTPLSEVVTLAETWLTLNETALLSLGLWFLTAFLFVAVLYISSGTRRTTLQYSLAGVVLLLLISLITLGGRLYVEQVSPAAVIVATEVDVTSGPGDQYITEFTLHAGTEVNMIEARNHWARLTLPGSQLQGWVPTSSLETVAIN